MVNKNRIGNLFSLTSFGESHGPAVGGVIDGMPAGITIDMEQLQHEMARRRPGQGGTTSSRNESDEVEILSGIMDGVTLGTPIGFIIRNRDQRSADYDHLKDVYRPSHADYTYQAKYGIRDHRGGGRASARETAARVVAGALAKYHHHCESSESSESDESGESSESGESGESSESSESGDSTDSSDSRRLPL